MKKKIYYDFYQSPYDKEWNEIKDIDIGDVEFKDGEFLSADDKIRIAKAFKRFVESGFKEEYFTKRLYEHFHLHCGFIAHYDKSGFYHKYFNGSKSDLNRFVSHFIKDGGYSRVGVWGDYEDIGKFIADTLMKYGYA